MKPEKSPVLNYRISVLQAVVLLYHVTKGANHPKVGFEDADRTLTEMIRALNRTSIKVNRSVLESALWSCNLMDENDEFWHPTNKPFRRFVTNLLWDYRSEFDEFYNFIKDKKKETNAST